MRRKVSKSAAAISDEVRNTQCNLFPEIAACSSVEVPCFQYLEEIEALVAIRLTALLRKATLDPFS